MKNQFLTTALLGIALTASGCQQSEPQPTVNQDQPLSVPQWRELEAGVKYELETLEVLRQSNPKLTSDRNWEKFKKDVIVPQRQIDFPADY